MSQSCIGWLRQFVGHAKIILPGAAGMVRDARGRVLLQRRRDSGLWGFPGGLMELGESATDAIRREFREEVGLQIEPRRLTTDRRPRGPRGGRSSTVSGHGGAMESKFISTPSGRFHAQVAGAGDVVLLIHGYSPQFNSWRTWQKNIDALARHHCVYALDLLGYGESDKPEPHPDAAFEANALIELMDSEKSARASLIGLSWGGGIAQRIAATAPERVVKLVLVDSASDAASLEKLRAQKIPTLITWDEDDAVIPVEHAHKLARALPHAQLRIFTRAERDPDANPENRHWSQETHSRVWNQVVTEFLKE